MIPSDSKDRIESVETRVRELEAELRTGWMSSSRWPSSRRKTRIVCGNWRPNSPWPALKLTRLLEVASKVYSGPDGCVTSPPCGTCAWCLLGAALDALGTVPTKCGACRHVRSKSYGSHDPPHYECRHPKYDALVVLTVDEDDTPPSECPLRKKAER